MVSEDTFKVMGWVSLKDFCSKIADVSYQTGLIWCKQERIKFVQVGGMRRIYEDEIRRFLREGTLPPNEEVRRKMAQKYMDYRIRTGRHKLTRKP